jgi:hypothetical protein
MHAEELRSVQAPLKERYRESPEAALITLRAQGRLGDSEYPVAVHARHQCFGGAACHPPAPDREVLRCLPNVGASTRIGFTRKSATA